MAKKLMILGASILQLPAIEKAVEMGLDVVVADMNPDAVGFQVKGVIKEVVSTIDIPAVLAAAKRHRIDGIMTLATDMPVRTVAAVAREMSLVGVTDETALKATDKAEMRKALQDANVPVPAFYRAADYQEYLEAVKNFTEPFMVKPADSSGSRGIFRVNDPTDETLVRQAYDYCVPNSRTAVVVVEEYMSGPEVSVETLSVDGKCHVIQITDKLTTGAPHFVEMGHSQPTVLDKETAEKIRQIAIAANYALGIKNGPSHTEIIVTKDGPKIVELGARLGGDCITTHLVPLSTGVDMVSCCINIALGQQPDLEQKFRKGSAIRYFSQKPGLVRQIDGVDQAEMLPGIRQISIVHGVGERVENINSSGSRMGFAIAQADTAEAAVAACCKAKETIKIIID